MAGEWRSLRAEIINALVKPAFTSTAPGRTSLLDGIPGVPGLERALGNHQLDLEMIVDQLKAQGKLTSGAWPLVVLINNAADHVKGFAVETELRELGDRFQKLGAADLQARLDVSQRPAPADLGSVLEGLLALLRRPKIHDSVIEYRKQFENVCKQIEVVTALKDLHDTFEKVGLSYSSLRAWKRLLLLNQATWNEVDKYELGLRTTIEDLLDRASGVSSIERTNMWTDRLRQAAPLLGYAIPNEDLEQLEKGMFQVERALSQGPSKIDGDLALEAKVLQRLNLPQDLSKVRDLLSDLNLEGSDLEYFKEFESEVTVLADQWDRLAFCVTAHNVFQSVDDTLRQVEAQATDQDFHELEVAMPDLRGSMDRLRGRPNALWVMERMMSSFEQLEHAMLVRDPRIISTYFRLYRGNQRHTFSRVDQDVYKQCGQLRSVGQQLQLVVRSI